MKNIASWQDKFEPCYYSNRLIDKLLKLNNEVNKPVDINKIKKAIYYAKKYHGMQMRQSGEPYYSHPLEVAYMISDYLFRTDILVSSILHDTIEDTELTQEMITKVFGDLVASQVADLTRIKGDQKISSAEMVELLYKQKKNDVLLIKLLDRLHNMQTIGSKSPEAIKRIIKETLYEFVICSIYLELTQVKQCLVELCYKNLIG